MPCQASYVTPSPPQVWRFLAFYVPVWIAMVAMAYMYTAIVRQLMDKVKDADNARSSVIMTAVRRLLAYPIIMFVGYIFGTINRIQNAADEDSPNVTLYCLATLTLNINGFFNALVYGCNVSVQNDIKKCLCGGDDDEEYGGPPPVADHHEDEEPEGSQPSSNPASGADGMTEVVLDSQVQDDIQATADMQEDLASPSGGL